MNTDTQNQGGGAARPHVSSNLPCPFCGSPCDDCRGALGCQDGWLGCGNHKCPASKLKMTAEQWNTRHREALGGPLTKSIRPSFEDDGHPTKATERAIANWDFRDAAGWLAYIREAWNHHYGRMWNEDGLLKMATGGWGGNEAVVEAMRRNSLLWSMLWESSHKGGLDVFRAGLEDHLPDTGKMASGKSQRIPKQ